MTTSLITGMMTFRSEVKVAGKLRFKTSKEHIISHFYSVGHRGIFMVEHPSFNTYIVDCKFESQ